MLLLISIQDISVIKYVTDKYVIITIYFFQEKRELD